MILDGKETWLKIFKDLKNNGNECSPRGQKILELEDYQINFNPFCSYLCSFKERNLSLAYNFSEFCWYLKGDRNDKRMINYSKFWNKVKNNSEPLFNSNYGHYFFKEKQVDYVIDILKKDIDTRQACIILNNKNVMMSNSKDKVCTNAIMFRIRNNKLNMSVQMRSSDVIYGMGIDAHMFSLIYQIIFFSLKEYYTDLQVGNYNHTSSSFHIYEKDFNIMNSIISTNGENYIYYNIPLISSTKEIKELQYMPNYEIMIREDNLKPSFTNKDFKFIDYMCKTIYEKWRKI